MLSAATAVAAIGTLRADQHVAAAHHTDVRPLMALGALAGTVTSFGAFLVWTTMDYGGNAAVFGLLCMVLSLLPLATQAAARVSSMTAVGVSKAAQGITQSVTQVFLSAMRGFGLQVGFLVGYTAALTTIVLTLPFGRRPSKASWLAAVTRNSLKASSKRYWKKSLTLTLAAAMNSIAVIAPPILLAIIFSDAAVGQFAIAHRVAVLPAGLVVAALMPVIAMRVGDRLRNHHPLTPMLRRHVRRWAPLGLAVGIFPFLLPSGLVLLVLGQGEWRETLDYLQALAPLLACLTVVGPLGQVLSLSGRATAQLTWDISRTVLMIAGSLVVAFRYEDPVLTVWTISVVQALMYLVYGWIIVRDEPSVLAR